MTRQNTSSCSFVANAPKRRQNRRTYAIIGAERGGTSAIAGVARALGIPMGQKMEGNNEDPSISNEAPAGLKSYIKQRNKTHDVWGWKYPKAAKLFPGLFEWMRNPYYIVVTRDPLKTVLSRGKWDGPMLSRSEAFALNEALSSLSFATSIALASGRPTLFVSYDIFIENRRAGISEIAEFLGTPMPKKKDIERILAYTEPGSYRDFADFFPELGDPK